MQRDTECVLRLKTKYCNSFVWREIWWEKNIPTKAKPCEIDQEYLNVCKEKFPLYAIKN